MSNYAQTRGGAFPMAEGSGYGPYGYGNQPGDPGYGYGVGGYGGYGPPPPPRRRRGGVLSHLAVGVLAAGIAIGATLGLYSPGSSNSADTGGGSALPGIGAVPSPPASSSGGAASGGEQQVVNKVEPGTVIINTSLQYNSEAAAGTGMVLNGNGLVLTNNHVIENSTKISATVVSTGKTYPAKVVGYDKTGDVALIQLQGASGLRTIPIGNSGSVKVGDTVVAMGNAEGQGSIVPVVGQVTGLDETITASDENSTTSTETLHGMVQTNADIVSGDSGGPLATAAGQVIGMDTAGNSVSTNQQQPAAGFAIPINTALAVARQIAAGHGSSTITIGYPAFVGIYIGPGTSSSPQAQAQQQSGGGFGGFGGFGGTAPSCYTSNSDLAVPSTIAPVSSGTLVIGVICGSPAASAGLGSGAVITAVNGQSAGSPTNLTGILAKYKPGDSISVTWVSPSGKTTTSRIQLVAGPPQ
jgi:S1-C subfamily serine protease